MGKKWLVWIIPLLAVVSLGAGRARPAALKEDKSVEQFRESWQTLEPITRQNLSVYPVVSNLRVDTSGFLTLDEGVATGAIRILEKGQLESPLYRRRDSRRWPERPDFGPPVEGASVNELVLVNESSRPLILLAGEVVSGGKQNRIIGADFVVPPKSDPIPLTVFCVERGRWSASRGAFDSPKAIAHPGIRKEAQVGRSQAGVWESVARSSSALAAGSPTADYLHVLKSPQAERAFNDVAQSIEAEYERELRDQLRGRDRVGVVVAINGELVWSDVFSSQELFRKYWPKLLRSYVIEAEGRRREIKQAPTTKEADHFLLEDRGHVTVHLEPASYRRTEISVGDYQIVALEAIKDSKDSGLLLHYNKMTRD